ncbi:hypothetical protein QWY28_05965 [Nocardioides sp. SOB77]|uniref:Big-1 domain-containing protein n=1 Tax=Nocardioides oceani TaxID=3058369 RepID=A0ABT8FD14_9ACTN|nr:hypothetical protein [Nocardioides oceani]MDN4172481.1 hypothetical protein [Nocardioides oceani]
MTRRLLLFLSVVLLVLAPGSARAEEAPPRDEAPVDVALSLPVGSYGETVTAELLAGRGGEPVPGLTVEFSWTSSGVEPESGRATTTTDEAGTARTDLVLGEHTVLTGRVLGAEGEELGASTVSYGIVCRCSPLIPTLTATGVAARNGDDRLVLRTHDLPVGAVVDLFRVTPDGERADRIRRSRVDEDGRRSWRVTDHNGSRATRYYAVALPTETSPRARTSVVRVR